MTHKEFAAEYGVTTSGFIKFPPDKPLRSVLFDEVSLSHPAKANIYMIQEIYRYVADPGETILDITAGIGTLMLAMLEGYNVQLIEIEEPFHNMQMLNAAKLGIEPLMLLGDCRDFLPIPCDHIIFSPPYSRTLNRPGKLTNVMKAVLKGDFYADAGDQSFFTYSSNPKNLGQLDSFMFGQQMEKIYKLCLHSVRPGGSMTIIIQDFIRGGERVMLGDLAVHQCKRMGWELSDWFKRYQPGTVFKSIQRAKGFNTVDDEDIIMLRRPQ